MIRPVLVLGSVVVPLLAVAAYAQTMADADAIKRISNLAQAKSLECKTVPSACDAAASLYETAAQAADRANVPAAAANYRKLAAEVAQRSRSGPSSKHTNGCSFSGQNRFSGPGNNPNGHDQTWNVTIRNETKRTLMCHITAVAPSVSGGDQGNGESGIRGQYVTFSPGERKTFTVNGAAGEGRWDVRGCAVNKTLDRQPGVQLGTLRVCNGTFSNATQQLAGQTCQARIQSYIAWYRSRNPSDDNNRVCNSEATREMRKRSEGGCGGFEARFDYPDDIHSVFTKEC